MLTVIKEVACEDIEGVVRVRAIPLDWTHEKYMSIWPYLTEHERDRYTTHEFTNVVTYGGLYSVNLFLANYTSIGGFAQYLALGNGALNAVTQNDTALVHETYRFAPSSATVVGNVSTVSTVLSASQAVATFTECALFGLTATSTAGSGTMNSHLLFSYTHTATVVSIDYSLTRN